MRMGIVLEDYQVSAIRGFLPAEPPLRRLPDYYNAWESICGKLHVSIRDGSLKEKVARLPMLDTKQLVDEPHWRRAYVLLGYIAHAYIWTPKEPSETLPAEIAVPLLATSEHLGIAPCSTYAAENLWNWRPIDPSRSIEDPSNFGAQTTFTGTSDEEWFLSIPAAIEARGAPMIPVLLKAFRAVSSDQAGELVTLLQEVKSHVEAIAAILPRMFEKCDPNCFYQKIRPFLAGTTGAKLPKGVKYEREDGSGECLIVSGSTAAQSSLFQFLDIALGVRHRPTGNVANEKGAENGTAYQEDQFLKKMRQHMPGGHRRFLEDVSKIANIREFVLSQAQNAPLQNAYDGCLRELAAYRSKHVQMVSRYLVVPSRAAARAPSTGTEAEFLRGKLEAGPAPEKQVALGTGGTAPIKYLKQVRNETQESILGKQ